MSETTALPGTLAFDGDTVRLAFHFLGQVQERSFALSTLASGEAHVASAKQPGRFRLRLSHGLTMAQSDEFTEATLEQSLVALRARVPGLRVTAGSDLQAWVNSLIGQPAATPPPVPEPASAPPAAAPRPPAPIPAPVPDPTVSAMSGAMATVGTEDAEVHLGFWQRHRLRVAEKHYEAQLRDWQEQLDGLRTYRELIDTPGTTDADGIALKKGEAVFGTIGRASLIESRVSGGHWVSGSSGFSVPVGTIAGHSVRYHVGRTRGHYVQGSPTPTAIDTGTLVITNQRVTFLGGRQTRDCPFAKLLGYSHNGGSVTISVSSRQKPTTVHFGPDLDAWFAERLELALAHFHDTVADLAHRVDTLIEEAQSHRPVAPATEG